MEPSGIKPALLFIPDISGFTQFVQTTAINHSQHIIAELLEVLIESNQMNMQISEIEGDAIFFYKNGQPSASEIAAQCKRMFIEFHQHLRKYDLSRICDCGACSTASSLTLKIIVHQGNISSYKIKDREKLFGADVILVHRLLKNNINHHEYMLMTHSIPVDEIADKNDFQWMHLHQGSSMYEMGEVHYFYSPFENLYSEIREPQRPEVRVYRVKNPLRYSVDIQAPMEFVYSSITDLKSRMILPGVLKVKIEDEKHNHINKIGTQHECIREPEQGASITAAAELKDDKMMFTETHAEKPFSFDYIVEKTGEESCRLTLALHLEMNFITKIMFNLFMKKKLDREMLMSQQNIKEYLEQKSAEPKPVDKAAEIVLAE